MPLFEIDGEGLTPFRLLRGGADLYENQRASLGTTWMSSREKLSSR